MIRTLKRDDNEGALEQPLGYTPVGKEGPDKLNSKF